MPPPTIHSTNGVTTLAHSKGMQTFLSRDVRGLSWGAENVYLQVTFERGPGLYVTETFSFNDLETCQHAYNGLHFAMLQAQPGARPEWAQPIMKAMIGASVSGSYTA
jgi:hypothetical protein